MKEKILVILTGGTIGSAVSSNTIDISEKSPYKLLAAYEDMNYPDYDKDEFETVQPYNILSENTTLMVWSELCSYLSKIDFSKYKGVIITHGTDTFSYTAALLGTIYDNKLDIPMVLVSSNYAIGEPKSNGLINFRNAVSFIKNSEEKGVFCIYSDRFSVNNVYRAVEITESDTCIDQFGVYGGEVYGTIEDGCFIKNENHILHCCPITEVTHTDISFDKDVLMLKTFPGLNYNYISLKNVNSYNDNLKPAAVIHNLYHSATACVQGDDQSIVRFIKRCSNVGIKSYICGFKKDLKDAYASTRVFEKTNAIKLYDMSPEAAYANVLILVNKS